MSPTNSSQKNRPTTKTEETHSAHAEPSSSAAVEPSGPRGDNPATAGPGHTAVKSPTPENVAGHLNPSAPEDANTTPGSTSTK
jgi:hypothetical protein